MRIADSKYITLCWRQPQTPSNSIMPGRRLFAFHPYPSNIIEQNHTERAGKNISFEISEVNSYVNIIINHLISCKSELTITTQILCTAQVLCLKELVVTPVNPTAKPESNNNICRNLKTR